MEMSNRQPTSQSYNSVISACMKEGERDEAASLSSDGVAMEIRPCGDSSAKRHEVIENWSSNQNSSVRSKNIGSLSSIIQKNSAACFDNLQCFSKVGRGSDSWWEIGRYSVADDKCEKNTAGHDKNEENDKKSYLRVRGIIIGIQPHRNPVDNGLSIVFFDEVSRVKLGKMLLKNAYSNQSDENKIQVEQRYCSSLVGMQVNEARRGEGLSKIFVAIWLRICLNTDAYPRAAVMNKPLIAYVLMGFDFLPQNGGSRVELIRLERDDNSIDRTEDGYNPQFALYSPSAKSLYTERVLRKQNIAILHHPPSSISREKGTTIYVKTKFEHPIAIMENAVEYKPHPLLPNEKMLGIEGLQNGDGMTLSVDQPPGQKQTTEARKLLDNQIHSVLKTNNVEGTIATGTVQLEFFSNSTLLKRAFLSYVGNC